MPLRNYYGALSARMRDCQGNWEKMSINTLVYHELAKMITPLDVGNICSKLCTPFSCIPSQLIVNYRVAGFLSVLKVFPCYRLSFVSDCSTQ